MKERLIISVFIIGLILGSSSAMLTLDDQTSSRQYQEVQNNSKWDKIQLVPDTNLTTSPDVEIVGTTGEFTYSYTESNEMHNGYANLTWTHNTGVTIQSNPETEYLHEPFSCDYVYFYEVFNWSLQDVPKSAAFNIEYVMDVSTDHPDFNYVLGLYTIEVFEMDSSGDWVRVMQLLKGEQPFDEFARKSSSVSGKYTDTIFGGTIEDAYGHQRDPNDNISIAVCLSPSDSFLYHHGEGYNWTVTLSVRYLDCTVYPYLAYDEAQRPDYVGLRSHSGSIDKFDFYDIEVSQLGLVYTLYNDQDYDYNTIPVITKWDSHGNLKWDLSLGQGNVGYGLELSESGSIYVVSEPHSYWIGDYTEITLTKISPDGTIIWQREIDLGTNGYITDFRIGTDGSFYAIGGFGEYPRGIELIKCNPEWQITWHKEWSSFTGWQPARIVLDSNNTIYATNGANRISKWDADGNLIWDEYDSCKEMFLYNDEFIFTRWFGVIKKLDMERNTLWDFKRTPLGMDIDINGDLWILEPIEQRFWYPHMARLTKINGSTGTEIWNTTWTIDMEGAVAEIAFGHGYYADIMKVRDGRVYITGDAHIFAQRPLHTLRYGPTTWTSTTEFIPEEVTEFNHMIAIFGEGPSIIGSTISTTSTTSTTTRNEGIPPAVITLVIIGSIGIVVLVIVIIRLKRPI